MLSPFYKALRMVTDLLTALALVNTDICESYEIGALQSRTTSSRSEPLSRCNATYWNSFYIPRSLHMPVKPASCLHSCAKKSSCFQECLVCRFLTPMPAGSMVVAKAKGHPRPRLNCLEYAEISTSLLNKCSLLPASTSMLSIV